MNRRNAILPTEFVISPSINPPKISPNIKPRPFGTEVCHLGAIHAMPNNIVKTPIQPLQQKTRQIIPDGPLKPMSLHLPSKDIEPIAKKPLSIKIHESPNIQAQKTIPTRCLSTKHSDNVKNEEKVQIQVPTITQNLMPALMPGNGIVIPNHDPAKCSSKRNGIVRAYSANTNQGLVRNYNEDRVAIILNILKPASRKDENWPKCSFFGVYDGHGGSVCADYLRDNLHQFVIREPTFPWNPREALRKGFENAEKRFLELAQVDGTITERSGSCAVVTLIVGDMCYVANVGDSRAVLSGYFLTSEL